MQFSICRTAWSRSEWRGHPLVASLDDDDVPRPKQAAATALAQAGTGAAGEAAGDSAGSGGRALDEVGQFLAARVSSWMPGETLTALGVDSLDEVQLRNDFQRTFSTKIPLSMFVVPNQTLGELCENLQSHLRAPP